MKIFEIPEIKIQPMEAEDIIATSGITAHDEDELPVVKAAQ